MNTNKLTYKEALLLANKNIDSKMHRICDFEEKEDKFIYNVLSLEDLTLISTNNTIYKEQHTAKAPIMKTKDGLLKALYNIINNLENVSYNDCPNIEQTKDDLEIFRINLEEYFKNNTEYFKN